MELEVIDQIPCLFNHDECYLVGLVVRFRSRIFVMEKVGSVVVVVVDGDVISDYDDVVVVVVEIEVVVVVVEVAVVEVVYCPNFRINFQECYLDYLD
jgi:hypothetical protein